MTKAIVQTEKGGPDVLRWTDRATGEPGKGEVLLRHTAIGVNFIDVYVREGAYPLMTLPGTPGMEAAGIVVPPQMRDQRTQLVEHGRA